MPDAGRRGRRRRRRGRDRGRERPLAATAAPAEDPTAQSSSGPDTSALSDSALSERAGSPSEVAARGDDAAAARGAVGRSADASVGHTRGVSSTASFRDLGVDEDLVAVLEAQDIVEPFPVQSLTIPDALAGKNVCGKAKTGSGKTLAFGLPVVQRARKDPGGRPVALILAPTRELARQVAGVIEPLAARRNLRAEAFYGGTSLGQDFKRLRQGADIVIGTPGRLIDLTERGELKLGAVRVVVLDEADRMCDMGFMPQVETLLRHLREREQTMLFSATLDGAVDTLVKIYLRGAVFHDAIDDDVDVAKMTHHFLLVEHADRSAVVAAIVRGATRPLVFTRTKRDADRLVDELRLRGIRSKAIHGDRSQENRESALDDFASGRLPVLVATDVAARGLHIDGVDIVVHYDPPEDPKAYVHRSGRTARAGETGVVVTLSSIEQRFDLWLLQRAIGVKADPVPVTPDDPRLATLATYAADD